MIDSAPTRGLRIERVLIVDPNPSSAKLLADLLRSSRTGYQIHLATSAEQAWPLASRLRPQLIFLEAKGPALDGVAFTRELRRSDLPHRSAIVVLISAAVTAAMIAAARDAGVHEIMRRPYTMGDLQKRMDAVSARPRPWIETGPYVGPDRRRFGTPFRGADRRQTGGAGAASHIL